MIPIIGSWSDLASKIIEIWRTIKESKDRELDREHQRRLQEAQHRHERALVDLKERRLKEETDRLTYEKEFLDRLGFEAEGLSDMGFDVMFEPINDGYGLALPMKDGKKTFVFWLSTQYPNQPPKILVRTSSQIEQIEFGDGAWQADRTLAEITSALLAAD